MADTWTTLAAVVVTGILSIAGNQLVEARKARNAQMIAERDARRAYEYEARKRLYTEAEPVFFALYDQAHSAMRRISNLAQATLADSLGVGGWLSNGYYRASTIYRLLAPLATYQLLLERVTLLDLSLDHEVERRYELARAAYRALELAFRFAAEAPAIPYNPDGSWERQSQIAATPRQGVLSGELQRAVGALIVNLGVKPRLMTYTEFDDEFQHSDSSLNRNIASVLDLFDERFLPSSRPVLWRVLVAQYVVYRAFRFCRNQSTTDDQLLELVDAAPVDEEGLRFGLSVEDQAAADAAWQIGMKYVRESLDARNRLLR